MKKVKNNYIFIIISLIFIIFGILSVISFCKSQPAVKNYILIQEKHKCLLNNNQDYCDNYDFKIENRDTISTLIYILNFESASSVLKFASPLLIIIVSSCYFHKYLRKGYLINSIGRVGYKTSIKKIYLKSIKFSLILPIFIVLMFIASCIISGNFDYDSSLKLYGGFGFNDAFARNWQIFMPVYIFNFLLNSLFWINIAIFNLSHNKNLIISIIVSFVEFFLLAVIVELLGVNLFRDTIYYYYFNLFNLWQFGRNTTLFGVVFGSIILVSITFLMVYFAYRNKEKVLEEVSK